jgi:DNA-binding IclR family transcriptional regulator
MSNASSPLRAHERDDPTLGTSVGKALTLLTAVGSERALLGVTALAERTKMPKSTAFRLLALLEEQGLVERVGTKYRLGVRVFELGNAIAHCRPRGLRDVALPHLVELHARTDLTVHLAISDGSEILYIEKICGHDRLPSVTRVGGRLSAHCTALGKALLAHSRTFQTHPTEGWLRPRTPYTIVTPQLFADALDASRAAGFAVDREESCIGLACVAAPVLDPRGEAVAAISLSGRTPRMVPERHAKPVRAAATAISRELTHRLPAEVRA